MAAVSAAPALMSVDTAAARARKQVIRAALAAGGALVLFVAGGVYVSYARHVRRDERLRDLVGQHLSIEELSARLRQDPGYEMKSPRTWFDCLNLTGAFHQAHMMDVSDKRRRWPVLRAFKGPGVVAFVFFDAAGTAQDYVLSER
jgi:hypothetical protein